ncbi:hypothetical protein JWJ90_09305 [Desulfobulbus rhabdoformis]|uniref:hypothetical protein n=1 Tax=Desulfobulbus rhabdoformis TaxID=34032 RepID=UPI001962A0F8|nr:hypothetical protein [Desulfobulbus rhabdoformis]MBM9614486.1 hypothetical protein [Desulfobulbus rhabdoformis]
MGKKVAGGRSGREIQSGQREASKLSAKAIFTLVAQDDLPYYFIAFFAAVFDCDGKIFGQHQAVPFGANETYSHRGGIT